MDDITVFVFAETWAKFKRQETSKKRLTRCNAPRRVSLDVPNQPASDRTQLCVRLPRPLKKRLEKLATTRGVSLTELIEMLIQKQVANVELTPDDYREIANDIERARKN
jgi:predicted HicB family RNase H-like nuclease